MRYYIATIKHNSGSFSKKVAAETMINAKVKISDQINCPIVAIIKIKQITEQKFYN